MKDKIDKWQEWDFRCGECEWSGKGAALETVDFRTEFCEKVCPQCGTFIDVLEFPLLNELMEIIDRFSLEEQRDIRAQPPRQLGGTR